MHSYSKVNYGLRIQNYKSSRRVGLPHYPHHMRREEINVQKNIYLIILAI